MKLRLLAWILALLVASVGAWAATEPAPPQRELKIYPLPNNPNSADISPDETLVATECTIQEDKSDPEVRRFVEVVQVWNFKDSKLVGEFRLKQVDVHAFAKGGFADPTSGSRFVRFSADGKLVVAYVDHVLHVVRTSDLTEIKHIETKGPDSTIHTYKHKGVVRTYSNSPIVQALELSPRADIAAVLWVKDSIYGRVELYSLPSGQTVGTWGTPIGWFRGNSMAWHPNGELLFVAVPNSIPCLAPGNSSDIFAFLVPSGVIEGELKTGLLVGGIAVTRDNRVLAVDDGCMTLLRDHNPKLKVFDLKTGKHLHDLGGRGTGVRYTVSAARNGGRVLAYTGKLKIKFDWGDFVANDVRVDATFSVWNLNDYSGIASSQDMKGLNPAGLRISPNGGFAVSCGKASSVYELP